MTTSSPTLIRDPWRRLWHFFAGNGFLAAVLILCAALLLIAALLPQTPADDLVAYSRWLSEAQTRFGNLFEALNALGLFSIAASPAFRLALAALGWCAALGNNFAVTSFWVSSNRKSGWSCTVNCPISRYLKLSYGYSTHAKARKYSLECGGETYEGNSLDELVSEYMKKVLANLKKQLSVLESVKKAGK